jgi:hypothetical protein
LRSHSRTRRFNFARTSRSYNFAVFPSSSPCHNRSSASARTEACLHQDHTFRCRPRQATSILHEQFAVPLDFVRGFLLNGLRCPSCAVPLFSPCGSALSRRATASRALSSAPAPSPTASPTPPHTCACAFPHRELRAQARANRSTTRRQSRIRTRTPALRHPARPPLLAHGSCTHRPRAAHAVACAAPRAHQRLIPRAAHAIALSNRAEPQPAPSTSAPARASTAPAVRRQRHQHLLLRAPALPAHPRSSARSTRHRAHARAACSCALAPRAPLRRRRAHRSSRTRAHTRPRRARVACRPRSTGPEPRQLPASALTGSAHAARSCHSCSAALAPAAARLDASGACSPACALLRTA